MEIETDVQVLKQVVDKLDASIEKISQVSSDIGKLLAVHHERLGQLEKSSDRRVDEIKDLYSRIGEQTKELLSKMDDMETGIESKLKEQHDEIKTTIESDLEKHDVRLQVLERWRWYILGAVAAVGYLLSNSSVFTHLVK